ncbi:PAS domain-containing sensor histidine kinase [Massilia forsythiae]|uniref:PAS domain-containing sensor histidine kinase n=1 Tax=Massilia forsythiae TaxID=2728020 RepID=UPI001E35B3C9|nr:PAS domain-containing sensor histidine kinase [Massilia forsythiae]
MEAFVTCSAPAPVPPSAPLASADAFRSIAELAGDLAFILDCATGMPVYLSARIDDLLGYNAKDIEQQLAEGGDGPLAALCGGLRERLRRFAAGDGSRLRVLREFEVRRPDGRLAPVEVISTLLAGADGKPAALAGIVRDLSARRARELEQKRFASMLNHEFRTPLSTIDGAIQRLEATGANADEATRQRYRKIAVAADRLIAMLDDYLSPERMAQLGRQRQPNGVSPRLLLEEVTAQARVAGRPVQLDADDVPSVLRGEAAGLRLALKVLLENALRYTPAGSALHVSGRRTGGGVELALRDEGPGVPEAEAPHIFGKGYRGANAAGLPGKGLGLYMARSVAEAAGGALGVVAAGGGAEFRLWLPAQDAGAKDLASREASSDNRNDNGESRPPKEET